MNKNLLSHEQVREAVVTFFTQNRFTNFNVTHERGIQFGAGNGRNFGIADVVITDDKGHWITIVECKSQKQGDKERYRQQLKSYLSGTDTRFGILAFSGNPDEWIYCENKRANKFIELKKTDFEELIFALPTAVSTVQDAIIQLKIENKQLVTDNKRLWNYKNRPETHNKQLETHNKKLETDKKQLDTHNRKLDTHNKQLERNLKLRTIVLSIAAVLILTACLLSYFLIILPMHTNPQYQVVRIIDGDTFEIQYKGKPTSVQLIGVNAPEPTELYSEEATMYLQEFLLDDLIHLRFDENKFDKHGRILGYVYRASDGIFVNLEVIREGYAEVDLRYPFKYKDLFMDYESRAKKDRKGLWGIIIEK